jgi:hypothetical protein
MNWSNLKRAIDSNDWSKMRRSPVMERKYKDFKSKIHESCEGNIKEYILKEKIRGEKIGSSLLCLTENDFPYDLHQEISHWIIWDLLLDPHPNESYKMYSNYANEKFDPLVFETLLWINPIEKQTVPDIPHCHVFVRVKFLVQEEDLPSKPSALLQGA